MKTELVMHVLFETILDMTRSLKCDVTDLSKTAIRARLEKDGYGTSNTTNGPMIDEAKIQIALAEVLNPDRIYVGLKAGHMREMKRVQNDSCTSLKKIIDKNGVEHEQLRGDHRELLNKHRELNDKLNNEQKKILAIEKENSGLINEISTLNKNEVELKNQIDTARKELVEKTTDVAVTKAELKVAKDGRVDALAMIKALESDLRSTESREQTANNNHKLAEQRSDMLEEQVNDLKAANKSLEARNRELEEGFRKAQQKLIDAISAEAATARLHEESRPKNKADPKSRQKEATAGKVVKS